MTRPTICVECRHYTFDMLGRHEPLCEAAPAAQSDKFDFIYGRTFRKPLCRLINRDGNCPHYEAKT